MITLSLSHLVTHSLPFSLPLQVLFKMNDQGDGKLIEMKDIGKANSTLVVRLPVVTHGCPHRLTLAPGIHSRLLSPHMHSLWL